MLRNRHAHKDSGVINFFPQLRILGLTSETTCQEIYFLYLTQKLLVQSWFHFT